jgi:uroporphyrinogen decarboxylase
MTPLEILVAAGTGLAAPRIPVFCNLLDQGARELGMCAKNYFQNGVYVAEAQLRMLRRYGYDNLWGLHYVGKEAELLGCKKILFPDDDSPNVAAFVIKSLDDIAKFEIPIDVTQHPAWQTTADCLAGLHSKVGATHPICAYITASTTLPTMLMGMKKWLELLLLGPADLRDDLLRKCSDFVRQQIIALRAARATVLVYSTPFGSPNFNAKEKIKKNVLPWMQRDLQPGGTADVVYYCGMAPFTSVIDLVFDELSIKAHYISPLADLAEAKRLINTRGLTCGVIDDIKMIHWTKEQTRAEVKRLIDIGKPFGTGVMEANIRDMLDAAFEYGRLE